MGKPAPFSEREPVAKLMAAVGIILMLVGLWVVHYGLTVAFVGIALLAGSREMSIPTYEPPEQKPATRPSGQWDA